MHAANACCTCLATLQAAQAGPEAVASCAARHAALLVRQQDWAAAASVLAAHGVAASAVHFGLYREVALEVLGASMQQQQPEAEAHARCVVLQACSQPASQLHALCRVLKGCCHALMLCCCLCTCACAYRRREYLYRLSLQLDAAGPSQVRKQDADDFRALLWACHYTALAAKAADAGLLSLAARQLTARLRYVGVVPADRSVCACMQQYVQHARVQRCTYACVRVHTLSAGSSAARRALVSHICRPAVLPPRAFFEAGMAWRAAGVASMAFVMLNRFLDLADAMEDPSGGGLAQLESADWAGTDVPSDVALPQQAYASEAAREEVRLVVKCRARGACGLRACTHAWRVHCASLALPTGCSCSHCTCLPPLASPLSMLPPPPHHHHLHHHHCHAGAQLRAGDVHGRARGAGARHAALQRVRRRRLRSRPHLQRLRRCQRGVRRQRLPGAGGRARRASQRAGGAARRLERVGGRVWRRPRQRRPGGAAVLIDVATTCAWVAV